MISSFILFWYISPFSEFSRVYSPDAHMHFSGFAGAIQLKYSNFSEIPHNNSGLLTVFKALNKREPPLQGNFNRPQTGYKRIVVEIQVRSYYYDRFCRGDLRWGSMPHAASAKTRS
jgi:hypothetical protein